MRPGQRASGRNHTGVPKPLVRSLAMRMRRLRAAVATVYCGLAMLQTGCQSSPPRPASNEVESPGPAADVVDDVRWAAEASLGKQSEILLQGDLALNGREQLFVVNRLQLPRSLRKGDFEPGPSRVFVARAAILEKEKERGKWSEILRCDEHVKNPSGYLAGVSTDSVAGWRIDYNVDSGRGLEMNFSPAVVYLPDDYKPSQNLETKSRNFEVRWNRNAKRYETYDQSHERFLGEVPSLEIPQSRLK